MLSFTAGWFAVAGMLAAAGPILIHLLNRRRFRTVDWAAMELLRLANQRRRRILRLRDLILLLVRASCLAGFGMALARPFLSSRLEPQLGIGVLWGILGAGAAMLACVVSVVSGPGRTRRLAGALAVVFLVLAAWGGRHWLREQAGSGMALTSRQPVHAVLLLDNSLSMATETLNGTLLAQARERAMAFVERLPPDSRVSVIPACGAEAAFSVDGYRSHEDVRRVLDQIDIVDRRLRLSEVVELARRAGETVPEFPAKRIVLLSDQQRINWIGGVSPADLESLPELQLVQIGDPHAANVWIEDVRVQDGILDAQTPATFLVSVRYRGQTAVTAQVTLSVEAANVATETVDLQPDQTREIVFRYQVDAAPEPGRPAFATVGAAVSTEVASADQNRRDNERYLVAPVVAGLPVVFVDQYGLREDLSRNQIGETYALRRLLAPRVRGEDALKQPIAVRHVGIGEVNVELLQDARLVVLAGLSTPGDRVDVLREYVEQGGVLVIAAGGQFDPQLWTEQAWRGGAGILPAPLADAAVGETLSAAANRDAITPFFLDFDSLQHPFFIIEGESSSYLRDLYRQPLFLKAVVPRINDAVLSAAAFSEEQRLAAEDRVHAAPREASADGESTGTGLRVDQQDRPPHWLLWRPEADAYDSLDHAARVLRSRPRVLARFTREGLPFLVERHVGRGRVLFVSSAVYSDWNNLPATPAIVFCDRMLRQLLQSGLPERVSTAGQPIRLPAEASSQLAYELIRPGGYREPLTVEALGADSYGISIDDALRAGLYRIHVFRDDATSEGRSRGTQSTEPEMEQTAARVAEYPLAVNAAAEESDLELIDAETIAERLADASYRWVAEGESISLEGAEIAGRDLWMLLIQIVLAGLLVEMVVLAWPRLTAVFRRAGSA